MMRKGQFLERAVVVPHGDTSVDALYHRGTERPVVLVVPPHPDEGSMEVPVVAELAWALARAGHATLRFNFPGVAASPGPYSEAAAAGAVTAASFHLWACTRPSHEGEPEPERDDEPVWLTVGRGVCSAVTAASPSRPLILVQPPLEIWPRLEPHRAPVRALLAEHADHRAAAAAAADRCPDARIRVVSGADAGFMRGLVALGRVCVETLKEISIGVR